MKPFVFRNSTKWGICIGFVAMLVLPVSCSTPNGPTNSSSSSSSSGGGTSNQVCIPGQQIACACPGGFSGAQACNEQGSGYDSCQCENGTGGTGGMAGMAGMGGTPGAGGMAGMAGMGGTPGTGGMAGMAGMGGTSGTGGMAGMGGTSGAGGMGGMGGGGACVGDEDIVLAANQFYFGEGNTGEWKTVGFNIDGRVSTGASLDLCQPNSGGNPSTAYPDGVNGIDNSFGKNILPTWLSLYPTFVTNVNNSLQNGNFTTMLEMDCLPPTGDVASLVTRFFSGTSLGMIPKWDGSDQWPVRPELLSDPMNPASSTIIYSNSSVTNMVFDSGNKVQFVLTIPISTAMSTAWVTLKIYSAHVTMNLGSDHKSATGGIIGGVLKTEEFIQEWTKVGPLLGICNTPLFANMLTSFRQASDIMADGSQDPAKTCDGISIGLGFDSKQVQRGGVGPMIPIAPTCP